ncbi:hypothetical protein ACFQ1S_21305, partial [Kibdelosporangium lantanae]
LVSKEGHCLYDLLGRVAAGEFLDEGGGVEDLFAPFEPVHALDHSGLLLLTQECTSRVVYTQIYK